jgi:hypothetical protein
MWPFTCAGLPLTVCWVSGETGTPNGLCGEQGRADDEQSLEAQWLIDVSNDRTPSVELKLRTRPIQVLARLRLRMDESQET